MEKIKPMMSHIYTTHQKGFVGKDLVIGESKHLEGRIICVPFGNVMLIVQVEWQQTKMVN